MAQQYKSVFRNANIAEQVVIYFSISILIAAFIGMLFYYFYEIYKNKKL
jgi:hypothetical protein